MIRRARNQDGFTVVELLLTLTIGLVVLGAALSVMDRAVAHNRDVQSRSDAVARGRTAMDQAVRVLRSQVCGLADETATSIAAGTATSVTFYADFGDGTGAPARHVLSLNPETGVLLDEQYDGVASATGTFTWPSEVSATRRFGHNFEQAGETPVFQYFGFDTADPPRATRPLATPLSSTAVGEVSRVVVTFRAKPERGAATLGTTLQDEVFTRSVNPNDIAPNPTCI